MPSPRGSSSPRGRPTDERLIDAMTSVVARRGYARLTVEQVLTAANVSRATFYQYFANVDDLFWSAYRLNAEQLVSDVCNRARPHDRPHTAVIDALVELAISRPDLARLLMMEGLAAGPLGVLERDALISRLEHAMRASAPPQSAIDLPVAILLGGVFRFLSMRLLDGAALHGVGEEVCEWAETFARRSSEPSWSAPLIPPLPRQVPRSSPALTVTRPRGTARERIVRATAATVRTSSYRETTVADIAAGAGVSRRSFYNEFASKADAFMAAYEHGFRETMSACAPAFFTSRAWPERVWDGARAFTAFLAREPHFAYLGFVECYALGPGFAARVHDTNLAFTLFLEEGYRQRPELPSVSRSCSALSAATIFEAGFRASCANPGLYIRRIHPLAVYIALTPFIGVDEAGAFVAGKLAGAGSSR